MPVESLWALIVALVILSLGLSFKFAEVRFSLQLAEKEINRLVEQVAWIKNHQPESISDSSQLNHAEINKIFQEYRNQINLLNEIILEMKTPTNYTAYLKKSAKMTLGLAHAIARGDVVLKKDL